MPIEVYKHLGLFSIILVTAGLGYLMYKGPVSRHLTFSQHFAATGPGRLLYRFIFTIELPLFYIFTVKWFVPSLGLSSVFTALFTVAVAGQLIAAYVPDNGGTNTVIHNVGAYAMATLLIPSSLLIAMAPEVSEFAKYVALSAVGYMLVTWYLLIFIKRAREQYLYLQAIYIVMYFVTILSATYA